MIDRFFAFVGALLVVGLIAGSFRLDEPDAIPEQLIEDAAREANEQDAQCARSPHTCERDAQEAAKDPRVQRTLQRLCSTGTSWACTLLKPPRPTL